MQVGRLEKSISQSADADIIKQVLAGKTALFEILVRRYNPYLYKVGRGYGFNHQDTEDAMQETFVNSYIHLEQFGNNASFKTWLIKIMLNQCYQKTHKYSYRNEKATDVIPDNSTFMFSAKNPNDNYKAVTNRELKHVIEACLQRLPLHYRTAFVLRELTGLSIAETAEIMHTSAANIKVQLHRAKAMLRKEIEKIYAPEEIFEFNLVYCDRIVHHVMQKIESLKNP